MFVICVMMFYIIMNDTAIFDIYTLLNTVSLHDALPIWRSCDKIAALQFLQRERAVSSKNKNFVANLASAVEASPRSTERGSLLVMGVLGNSSNRLADLATGAVVDHPQERVDPARCRIRELHNHDYAALTHA